MLIQQFVVGPVETNCYIIHKEGKKEALIIDPGAAGRQLAEHLRKEGLRLAAVLLTHGHADHAGGIEDLLRELKDRVPVIAYEGEKRTLADPNYNLSSWILSHSQVFHADLFMRDGEEKDLAGLHFRLLATPGHTEGGCCFYFPYENVLFSGDSLFAGSLGRTDFPGGSVALLVRSVKEKLMTLPEGTRVLPGHEGETTIGEERVNNPYLL